MAFAVTTNNGKKIIIFVLQKYIGGGFMENKEIKDVILQIRLKSKDFSVLQKIANNVGFKTSSYARLIIQKFIKEVK